MESGSSSSMSEVSEVNGVGMVELYEVGLGEVVLAGTIELKMAVPNDGVGSTSELVDML